VVLPLFVARLTDDPRAVGLIPMVWGLGYFVPQLFAAAYSQRRRYKLKIAIGLYSVQRLSLFATAALALVAARDDPQLVLIGFFIFFALATVTTGSGLPFHQDVIARVLPVHVRGRLRGLAMTAAGVVGTVGGFAAREIIEAYPFPTGFAICFLIAGVLGTLSLVSIALIPEPPAEVGNAPPTLARFLAAIPRIMRDDANFARFIGSRLAVSGGAAALPFIAVAAVGRFDLPESSAGLLIAAYTAGSTLATGAWGWLADRFGHRLVLMLGSAALALALGGAAVAPSPAVAYIALALAGAYQASYWVSSMMVVLEFGPSHLRPTYVGLASTAIAPVTVLAPFAAGLIAAWLGFQALFAIAFVPAVIGTAIVLLAVKDPRDSLDARGGTIL
jgi:MFS family permease